MEAWLCSRQAFDRKSRTFHPDRGKQNDWGSAVKLGKAHAAHHSQEPSEPHADPYLKSSAARVQLGPQSWKPMRSEPAATLSSTELGCGRQGKAGRVCI